MENPPPAGFVVVETEIELLRHDGVDKLCVRGAICKFARTLYRARQTQVVETVSPRARLHSLLGPLADKVTSQLLGQLIQVIDDQHPQSVAELLFYLTHDEFWIEQPSVERAAMFLLVELDPDLCEIADIQRRAWLNSNSDQEIKRVYEVALNERQNFLRKWFFDRETRTTLGEFPLKVSDQEATALKDEVERALRLSNGACVSEFPKRTPNKGIYADAVFEYFSHNPNYLTSDTIAQMSGILSRVVRASLERLLQKRSLSPIESDAEWPSVLKWVTEDYLPFCQSSAEDRNEQADVLAASFGDWILENYPRLTNSDRETSPLNLRTFYTVKTLSEQYWVLWVVVDGLNYTNHRRLLQLLSERSENLRVEVDVPLFAVLPTITERAKYGLTSGKFPQENLRNEWATQNVFLSEFPDGVYAGNAGASKLRDGLNREKPTVCYWNYTSIDDCFHDQTDLEFAEHEVDGQLRSLSGKINQLVLSAANPNRVAVVICTDHGQVRGRCRKLQLDVTNQKARGRTVLADIFGVPRVDQSFTKNPDGETVYLNPKSFRLNEPTTLALGPTYFVDWQNSSSGEAIGVHGGLFPEEVVVGLSVLLRHPMRKLLSTTITGAGETGSPGSVAIQIDNPNSGSVTVLAIQIEGLQISEASELLFKKIDAKKTISFDIVVKNFPLPQANDEFPIQGILHYEFEDGAQEECAISGKLTCKSLYSARNPKLRDRL